MVELELTLPESDYVMLDVNDRITTLQADTERRLQILEEQLKAATSASCSSPKRKGDEVIPADEVGASTACSKTYSQSELDNAVREAVEKAMEVARDNTAVPVLTQTYVRGGGSNTFRGRFSGNRGRGRGRGGRGGPASTTTSASAPTTSREIPAETTEDGKRFCTFCKREGHLEGRCFDKRRAMRELQSRGNARVERPDGVRGSGTERGH
ncbi:uncharacterized protein LOC129596540 [Paramacrobiotus metropolitanus]|uniref:uncharacterized protein LOC129596540 n=1 Tax=Paramacrobiotus metropolitanus TaxID=2943436 RepID=UPI002445E248|nr:uncharacterized protein LOC129596540 [Paramacrobiotus metropolitanus]